MHTISKSVLDVHRAYDLHQTLMLVSLKHLLSAGGELARSDRPSGSHANIYRPSITSGACR